MGKVGDGPLIVLDTHAWLWSVDAPARLSPAARRTLASADRIGIVAISLAEVASLADRQVIRLDRPTQAWLENALAEPKYDLVPLTPAIAVRAAGLGGRTVTDPADRLIAATAIEMNATLVTRDRRLLAFEAVRTVW